jgi:plastocyanin
VAGTATRDQGVQVNAFLPKELQIDVGDTVKWTVGSGEFHTVSFLSGGARPDLIVVGPNGPDFNPVVVAPSGGTSYGGTGYVNSGLLFQGQSFGVTFTAPGDYPFVCLIHSEMAGTLHVRPAGTPYPETQAAYDQQARTEGAQLQARGLALQAQGLAAAAQSRPGLASTAGTGALLPGTATLAVVRFLPQRLTVHAGQTVTWTNRDPEFPHTVTFGPEPGGGPLGAFPPIGASGGHATVSSNGTTVNSGFIGAGLPGGTTFSATFPTPGTYPYICALHDDLGMTGTIVVLP